MLNVKNMGSEAFRKYIKEKQIYIYGAGRALESCLDLYFGGVKVNKIVDSNPELWGKNIVYKKEQVEVISKEKFALEMKGKDLTQCILLITSSFYAAEIVEELDLIPELDGMECFLQILIRNTKEKIAPYDFTKGDRCIPKKIHYIWIGGKELPDKFKKNIESWHKYNPDFDIIRWDESNYDFSKISYMKEAYETRAWGFVPNYARLDIIYQQGGIYLDTDVEAVNSFDLLLNDQSFFCMGCTDRVNLGCGFGAAAKQPIISDMMREFEKRHFLSKDGKPEKRPCHTFIHPVIKKYGFNLTNQYQRINDIVLYPTEVMSPLTINGMQDFQSEKTVSIHQEVGTWRTDCESSGVTKLKEFVQTRV